ncbi:hypothetical protein PT2222_470013 [Paraburkholderia tropica]
MLHQEVALVEHGLTRDVKDPAGEHLANLAFGMAVHHLVDILPTHPPAPLLKRVTDSAIRTQTKPEGANTSSSDSCSLHSNGLFSVKNQLSGV